MSGTWRKLVAEDLRRAVQEERRQHGEGGHLCIAVGLMDELLDAVERATGTPLPVVGTPWTTPLKGDKCVRSDGKSREAVKTKYTSFYGSGNRDRDTPAVGYWPSLVTYRDQKGREDTISASSWATWCRAACREGGTYTRTEQP